MSHVVVAGGLTAAPSRRTFGPTVVGLLVLAVLSVAALARPGDAEAWDYAPTYIPGQLIARHSGGCLDVAHASRALGAPVIQARCWGGLNQQWTIVPLGHQIYQVRARHSNQCLDVKNAVSAHGAPVVQAPCMGPTYYHQLWRFAWAGNDGHGSYYALYPDHDGAHGWCLDVAHASNQHLAPIIIGRCNRTWNQQWRFRAM